MLRGYLAVGAKLPPSRKLAASYKVTRNTVIDALSILADEGYLLIKPQSGIYVQDLDKGKPNPWKQYLHKGRHVSNRQEIISFRATEAKSGNNMANPRPHNDFSSDDFIVNAMKSCGKYMLLHAPFDRRGFLPLRKVIAEHLANVGINADAEQILITSGTTESINLILYFILQLNHWLGYLMKIQSKLMKQM